MPGERDVKPVEPTSGEMWGVLNPYGQFWSYNTFNSEAEARAHVERFWHGLTPPGDLSRFTPVRVRVTVELLTDPSND
jgi:hypothetical protein